MRGTRDSGSTAYWFLIAAWGLVAGLGIGEVVHARSFQQQGVSASTAVGQVRSTLTRSVSVLDEVETAVEQQELALRVQRALMDQILAQWDAVGEEIRQAHPELGAAIEATRPPPGTD